ncbi:MAG TPA: hypothetical protein VFW31_16535 [Candidatus Angelobacter sp.]|nr:hypothetical protein [Candidatus Angelobacter sp.]
MKQAEIAASQTILSAEQLEGASRPILVLQEVTGDLTLANIGTGPALSIKWWLWPEEDDRPGSLEAPAGRVSFIEPRQRCKIGLPAYAVANPRRKIVCFYEGVSGKLYRSDSFQKQDTMVGRWYEHKFVALASPNKGNTENAGNNA